MYDAVQHGASGDALLWGRDELDPGAETQRWFEFDPTPIIIAELDGRVLRANPAGCRALAEVATVAGDGRLAFSDVQAGRTFDSALATVASGAADRASTILRCDDGFWRRITVMRCGAARADAVFIILHGADGGDTDITALAEAFGLTPMESRILAILSRGASAKAIAAQFGISPHTVRAHLRSLYGKTKVRGLCDLVREYTRLTS